MQFLLWVMILKPQKPLDLLIESSQQPYEVGLIVIPLLMGKRKLKEVKSPEKLIASICLLCARHCSRRLAWITLFAPHSTSTREGLQ